MSGEPLDDGDMNEMTLPSRHGIRNTSPDGLRPSTLPLVTEVPHNLEYEQDDAVMEIDRDSGCRPSFVWLPLLTPKNTHQKKL